MVNRLLEGSGVKCHYGGDAKLCRGGGEGAHGERGREGSPLGPGKVWEHPQDGEDALSLQGRISVFHNSPQILSVD